MKIIFMILFTLLTLNAELTKSGDFVIDKKNNLMWQDSKDNVRVLVSHLSAPEYCDKLVLGGFTNWRVPTVDEYKLIIDKTRKDEIMIDQSFRYILPEGYWTADRTWRTLGKWGYYVYFKSGTAYYENRTYKKLIRCVRDTK